MYREGSSREAYYVGAAVVSPIISPRGVLHRAKLLCDHIEKVYWPFSECDLPITRLHCWLARNPSVQAQAKDFRLKARGPSLSARGWVVSSHAGLWLALQSIPDGGSTLSELAVYRDTESLRSDSAT